MIKSFLLILPFYLLVSFSNSPEINNYEEYFNKNLLTSGQLNNGTKIGTWHFYYPNGNEHFSGSFANGQMNDHWSFYRKNNKPISQLEYKNGILDGLVSSYDEKGNLIHTRKFVNSKFSGESTWYENGTKSCTVIPIVGGRKIQKFYPDGSIQSICVEWKGKQNDTAKVYFENGVQKEILVFYKSLLLNVGESLSENGEKLDNGNFEDGSGKLIRYYNNGKKRSVVYYKGGLKHGIAHFYHSNGTLASAGLFTNGYKNGIWKNYNQKGELINSEEFRNSLIDQEFVDEFSWSEQANGYSTTATFPGGDKALNRFLKNKIQASKQLKNLKLRFFAKLDKLGFLKNHEVELIQDSNSQIIDTLSFADFPRCQPALCDGLPCEGEINLFTDL